MSYLDPSTDSAQRYGGPWTQGPDAPEQLAARLADGRCPADLRAALEHYIEFGYAILPGAAPLEAVDRFNAEIEEAWRTGDARIKLEIEAAYQNLRPELRTEKVKLLDLYVGSEAAREMTFARPISNFLAAVFECRPLAFQGLYFDHGTEQPIHQDTAYVPVVPPMDMAAAWIACEDVEPGTGELAYYPGSHRFPMFLFPNGRRHWEMGEDGWDVHERYLASLHERAAERGIELQHFRPRKGDALIWSADLAHGGSEVKHRGTQRRSLVVHYCPETREPGYFTKTPEYARRVEWGERGVFASGHYPLG